MKRSTDRVLFGVSLKAVKNGINLFDAKYHMFLRATDGVFITLAPDKHVFFDRTEYYINNNGTKLGFRSRNAILCHSIFLLGEINKEEINLSKAEERS
ncbi:MAG: hypothetical protein V8Q42_09850 [Anaerovoracaceae bacterium]